MSDEPIKVLGQTPKILILDDDAAIREQLRAALEEAGIDPIDVTQADADEFVKRMNTDWRENGGFAVLDGPLNPDRHKPKPARDFDQERIEAAQARRDRVNKKRLKDSARMRKK